MELFSFLHSRRRKDACVVVILDEKRKATRLAALLPNLASLLRPEMSPTICCAERWSAESIKIGIDVYQLWDEHIMETAPTLDIKGYGTWEAVSDAITFLLQSHATLVAECVVASNRLEPMQSLSSSLIWNDCCSVCVIAFPLLAH
jgi:hypothetical protein